MRSQSPSGRPGSQPKTSTFTTQDLWSQKRIGAPVVSPDGRFVAFSVAEYDLESNQSTSSIEFMPVTGGAPFKLTAGSHKDRSPSWCWDSSRLVFTSDREDQKAQLYVINRRGGEARRVTNLPVGVEDPHWVPGQEKIVFMAMVPPATDHPDRIEEHTRAREKKDSAYVTEDRLYRYWDHWLVNGDFYHFFILDLPTRDVRDLTPGMKKFFDLQEPAGQWDLSPDGKFLIFAANRVEPPYETVNFALYRVALAGGPVEQISPDDPYSYHRPRYSPDGKMLAYGLVREPDFYADPVRLVVRSVTGGETSVLTEGWDRSCHEWSWSRAGDALHILAEEDQRQSLFTLGLAGGEPGMIVKGGTLVGVTEADDRVLVYQRCSLEGPPEIECFKIGSGQVVSHTQVNDPVELSRKLGEVKEFSFEGAGGDPVKMFVIFPPGFTSQRTWPLLQLIHGGPHGIFGDVWHYRWNPHVFASAGYVVAMVNFHGSTSFGDAFARSIHGAQPFRPFEDVMKSTDFLIAQGFIDPDRMGAAGASYGGFLIAWIAGHTDRFKALVDHAGVYDLMSQYASDITYGRSRAYGASPWDNPAHLQSQSPAQFVAGFRTPMLIVHGEQDYRVPVSQGLEVYNVMKNKGVPARLVYFPDENHWVMKTQNSIRWYKEVLEWLDRWVKS